MNTNPNTKAALPAGLAGSLILPARSYARTRRPWLEARKQGLGASDTAAVLGLSQYRTPLDVWLEKTGQAPDNEAGEAATWGTRIERVVADEFSTRHPDLGKIAPTPGLLAHDEHPWMLATLDRLLVERGSGEGAVVGAVEVKTTSEWNYRRSWIDGLPPFPIRVQCQQQLAVTGLPFLYVAVLVGGQKMPDPIKIERDERVIGQLIEYAGTWWQTYVVGGVRPEPTFRDDLTTLWPGDPDEPAVIAVPGESEMAYQALMDARERKASAEADEKQAAFALQRYMEDATTLTDVHGNVLVTWKPTSSSRFDQKAFKADHPDLAAKYMAATTTRRFLPKPASTTQEKTE